MQSCGKFFYNVAVSRVQLNLCLGATHYFVQEAKDKFKHCIFKVNAATKSVKCITDTRFDFFYYRNSVLLGDELYC